MKSIFTAFCLCVLFTACEYEKYAAADYPDQQIYIPAVAGDPFYIIDDVPAPTLADPTPGQPSRFRVDREAGQLIIPLSVYRAGINNDGAFDIKITADADTVTRLIAQGALEKTEILPADQYTVDTSVRMQEGEAVAPFYLNVDLQFLKDNAPDKKYALGIKISAGERKNNEKLSTVIVVIDTKIMTPSVDFTFRIDVNNWNKILFNSTSAYAMSYSWQFGDEETSGHYKPEHSYPKQGIYAVTLTVKGVFGDEIAKTQTIPVLNILPLDKSKWSVVDFSSEESGAGSVTAVFDDNITTFWSSATKAPIPPFPHWFVLDLGEEVTVRTVESVKRQNNTSGQTEYQLLTSTDGTTWVDHGLFTLDQRNNNGQSVELDYPTARYIKYVATQGKVVAYLAELNIKGATMD